MFNPAKYAPNYSPMKTETIADIGNRPLMLPPLPPPPPSGIPTKSQELKPEILQLLQKNLKYVHPSSQPQASSSTVSKPFGYIKEPLAEKKDSTTESLPYKIQLSKPVLKPMRPLNPNLLVNIPSYRCTTKPLKKNVAVVRRKSVDNSPPTMIRNYTPTEESMTEKEIFKNENPTIESVFPKRYSPTKKTVAVVRRKSIDNSPPTMIRNYTPTEESMVEKEIFKNENPTIEPVLPKVKTLSSSSRTKSTYSNKRDFMAKYKIPKIVDLTPEKDSSLSTVTKLPRVVSGGRIKMQKPNVESPSISKGTRNLLLKPLTKQRSQPFKNKSSYRNRSSLKNKISLGEYRKMKPKTLFSNQPLRSIVPEIKLEDAGVPMKPIQTSTIESSKSVPDKQIIPSMFTGYSKPPTLFPANKKNYQSSGNPVVDSSLERAYLSWPKIKGLNKKFFSRDPRLNKYKISPSPLSSKNSPLPAANQPISQYAPDYPKMSPPKYTSPPLPQYSPPAPPPLPPLSPLSSVKSRKAQFSVNPVESTMMPPPIESTFNASSFSHFSDTTYPFSNNTLSYGYHWDPSINSQGQLQPPPIPPQFPMPPPPQFPLPPPHHTSVRHPPPYHTRVRHPPPYHTMTQHPPPYHIMAQQPSYYTMHTQPYQYPMAQQPYQMYAQPNTEYMNMERDSEDVNYDGSGKPPHQ